MLSGQQVDKQNFNQLNNYTQCHVYFSQSSNRTLIHFLVFYFVAIATHLIATSKKGVELGWIGALWPETLGSW